MSSSQQSPISSSSSLFLLPPLSASHQLDDQVEDEDKYQPVSDDPMSNLILEAIKNDDLRKMERAKKWDGGDRDHADADRDDDVEEWDHNNKNINNNNNGRYEAEHSILTAAKLISPVIEETFSLGYNWSITIMIMLMILDDHGEDDTDDDH